jgi:hypothetical protein
MQCDVCSQDMDPKRGYILSASQLVYDPGYWKRAFRLRPLSAEQLERVLPGLVRQMSGSESDWVVCEECMGLLKQDRSTAAKYYADYVKNGKRPQLPDTGPATADRAAIVASGAFEALFGRPPSTIKFQESAGRVISSVELSQQMAAISKTGDRNEMRRLGSLQVQCGACKAVMPVVECRVTSSGMSCPRCDRPWFLMR